MISRTLKVFIFLGLATIFLVPVITTSLHDLEQKKINEENAQRAIAVEQAEEQARLAAETQRIAEEKIYLLGKFDQSKRDDFAAVPKIFNVSGYTMYLRHETLDAFTQMATAAKKNGITLKIASATRNFDYQKGIWESKWNGTTLVDGKNLSKTLPDSQDRFYKILEYSAVPGTSRHHWGTDIDINGASVEYFETEEGGKVYDWLTENAAQYGFCQPYTAKGVDRLAGYNEEKWHWSYVPLSRGFTNEYKKIITEDDISGFLGDENVKGQNLINNYVLGVNSQCL